MNETIRLALAAVAGGAGGVVFARVIQHTWTLLKKTVKFTAKKFHLSNREACVLYLCIITGAVLAVVYGQG